MASYKNYLIAFLSLTTVAGAYFAWQNSRAATRPHETTAIAAERADLRKRVWDAEKRVQSLQSELANVRASIPAGNPAPALPPAEASNRRQPGAMMGMMENPEYQKLMAIQQKAMLDGNYAALFRKLNLSPHQLEQFKQLLVERQTSMIDLHAVAQAQGLDPRTDPAAYRKLVEGIRAEVDQAIKATLGEEAYVEYKDYEASTASRGVLTQLEQRLSYHGTSLSETQGEQLLQIFNSAHQARMTAAGVGISPAGAGNVVNLLIAGGPLVTDEVMARASSVLASDQLAALQQIKQEQESGARMRRMLQEQMGSRQPGPNSLTMPAVQLPNR